MAVRREHWTLHRWLAVTGAIVAFYVTYLAYRNLKSMVPLLRPGDLFDGQLADVDRALFLGHDPAALLHDVVGTGLATHVFSGTYMLFFLFIPGTLAVALVFSRNLSTGLFYATALSLNWLLGRRELLPAAVARADLRRPGRVRRARGHRRRPAAGDPARAAGRVPARPGARDRRRASARSPPCTSRSSSRRR